LRHLAVAAVWQVVYGNIRNFILGKMGDLRALLDGDPAPAGKELLKHVSEIRMMPQVGNGLCRDSLAV
jgi:hypothetical protein